MQRATREQKKIAYGIAYAFVLAILILIVMGIWAQNRTPTCSDQIQNQNETGVDCGGACPSCALKQVQPLRVSGSVQVFTQVAGSVVFLARVSNPNALYAAQSFAYQLRLYDSHNAIVSEVGGESAAGPSEQVYIYASDRLPSVPEGALRAELTIVGVPEWQAVDAYVMPEVQDAREVITHVENGAMRVEGIVQNIGASDATRTKVIALLHDRSAFHDPVFAAATDITVPAFSEKKFTIAFPADPQLNILTDPQLTEVFVHSR